MDACGQYVLLISDSSDSIYERLAVVGDKKWQQAMTTFFKPFTTATIRYFDLADAAEARKWISES